MQRFEDYNLAGTRRPVQAPVPDTLADRMVRRALDSIRHQAASQPVTARSTKRSNPVVPVTARGFERRPAGSVQPGAARRGGGHSLRVLRELRNMDHVTFRSIALADPGWLARVMAQLDGLIDQLDGEQRDGRPSC